MMKIFGVVLVTVTLCARYTQACLPQPVPTPSPFLPSTEPPTDEPETPTQATEPPPAECPNITPTNSTPGRAPLYGTGFEGIHDYVVVLVGMNTNEVISKMLSLNSPRPILSIEGLNSANGINAVAADLDEEQLDEVRQIHGVEYVEKEEIVRLSAAPEWGLDRIDQRKLPLDNMYKPTGNGQGAVVYVMDTGVNTGHKLFQGRAKNWNEVVKVPGNPKEDCNGHGTAVAGKVGAMTHGVAMKAEIRSVRVFGCKGETTPKKIVAGINAILDKGKGGVVTMSFQVKKNKLIDDAVAKLIKAGYVVVAAAGNRIPPNRAVDVCDISPARVPKALTVGASNAMDKRIDSSNFGAGVDLFAPGANIKSLGHLTNNQIVNNLQGTSMAAPHVSGVAAILLARGTPANKICQKIIDLSTKNELNKNNLKKSPNRLLFID